MRWTKKLYKKSDIRVISTFALFPIRIREDVRWLEWVNIEQKLLGGYYSVPPYWHNRRFVEM